MRAVGPYRTEMPWHTALTVLTVARLSRLKDFQYPAGVRARRSRPDGEMYVPGPRLRQHRQHRLRP
jgi:hypothetical protein